MHFQIPCAPPLEQFGEEKAQASSAPSDAISDRSPPVFPPLNLNTVRVRVVMSKERKKNKGNFEHYILDFVNLPELFLHFDIRVKTEYMQ